MRNEGLAIHCHHDQLIEWCHSYQERVDYINSDKPEGERAVRLRLFKLLPQAAIKALPKGLVKVNADWDKVNADWHKASADMNKASADWDKASADMNKASADWDKVNADWHKAYADLSKASADRDKAYVNYRKANARWSISARNKWHTKWCGCKEWDGQEVRFR